MSFNQIQSQKVGATDSQTYLDTKNSTILKPKSAEGISGFIFDIPDTESINLTADITDHFTESNSFLNDHIVIKPDRITLSGFVGELKFRPPEGIAGALEEIQNRLQTVPAYLGDLTPGAQQTAARAVATAQTIISGINQTVDRTKNLVGFFAGEEAPETEQQKAFNTLDALRRNSEILTVQTPWKYFESVMIQSIAFSQDGNSKDISDISVTLKEIRIADIKTVDYDQNQFPPRVDIQGGEEENQGIVQGQERNSSFLFDIFGGE